VAKVTDARWEEIDRWLESRQAPDPALADALAANARAGLPAIDVAPNQGRMLGLLARMTGARAILEVGTLGGYSTIWLARALAPGGRLVTLEVDPCHAAVATANLERAGMADRVTVIVGSAAETLPTLEGPFDFVFLDADKQGTTEYFAHAIRLTRPGGAIVVDNVVRAGDVLAPASDDPKALGMRRFHEALAAETRVAWTTVQTVGSKGHDGFTLAVVSQAS
jgi:predicted O-methyltransferase YrrM